MKNYRNPAGLLPGLFSGRCRDFSCTRPSTTDDMSYRREEPARFLKSTILERLRCLVENMLMAEAGSFICGSTDFLRVPETGLGQDLMAARQSIGSTACPP